MNILGISAYYHDSAAAIIRDGKIICATQEERLSRIKNDASFPEKAIAFCLTESGLEIGDLDYVVFYDKPFLKFERLLETYYAFAPKGFLSFAAAMPVWLKEKLYIKPLIRKKLRQFVTEKKNKIPPVYFTEHHLSHVASAFYTSPFSKCAFLTVDGVGEWSTISYGTASGDKGINVLGELHFPDSVGLLYSSFTYYLGFEVNSGEYKMMGLAPYSHSKSEQVASFKRIICENLVDIKPDGSLKLNMDYFEYPVGLRMVNPKKWERLFGLKRRLPEEPLEQVHADLAFAAQKVVEEILVKLIRFVKEATGENELCLAGGVALNCVANSEVYGQHVFDDIYVQPAAGDAGGALGAALATYYLKSEVAFKGLATPFNAYLGQEYSNEEIARFLKRNPCNYRYFDTEEEVIEMTTRHLAAKKIVGWFRGRAEFGPRALGNRSILADATEPDMQQTLNMKIKFRENFRPFAPVVCEEDYSSYFEPGKHSYYMLFTSGIKKELRKKLPDDFQQFSIREKCAFVKSDLPAVTHIDYSARVQVVTKEMNPVFWKLIQSYKELTGTGVLINTSFNVKDEPIVNSPEDAYICFVKSQMDVLVLGNYIIEK